MARRILRDEGEVVVIDGGDGREIRVAKRAVSPLTLQGYADGGTVEDLLAPDVSVASPVPFDQFAPATGPVFGAPVEPALPEGLIPATPEEVAAAEADRAAKAITVDSPGVFTPEGYRPADQPPLAITLPSEGPQPPLNVAPAPTPQIDPTKPYTASFGTPPVPSQASEVPPAPPKVAPPAPKPEAEDRKKLAELLKLGAKESKGPAKQTLDWEAQQIEAAQATASVLERESQKLLEEQNKIVALKQKWAEESKARVDERRERGQKLFDAAYSKQIDPRRLWASKSTGEKISASIGLILGGMGAGLTRGPNQVLELLNKQIDRDIDAQRSDLENKRGLYNEYIRNGVAEDQAYQLAKADALDVAAAELARASQGFAGEKAKIAAKTQVAEVRKSADLYRLSAEQQRVSAAQGWKQIEQMDYNLRLQKESLDALTRLSSGAGGQSGAADLAILRKTNPELAKQFVRLDNRYVFKDTPEMAESARQSELASKEFRGAKDNVKKLRQQVAGWQKILPDSASGLTKIAAKAPGALADLKKTAAMAIFGAEPRQLPAQDLALIEDALPDLLQLRDAQFDAKLDELQKLVNQRRRLIRNQ